MNIKNILVSLVLAIALLGLTACSQEENESSNSSSSNQNTIKIATMEEFYFKDVVSVAKEVLEKQGYQVEIVTIADNITPNVATEEGTVDYNFYQHIPFLDAFNESDKGGNLAVINEPITAGVEGLYSTKFDSLEDITDGALVAIPNDSSNRTMHLRFMERLGLLTLPQDLDVVTTRDIIDNPHNFQFVEMDTPSIVNSLEDVDLGTCSQSSIVKRGIDPSTALATYADEELGIVLVAREENAQSEVAQKVYEAFTSQEVKDYIDQNYKNVVEPLF